MYDKEDNEKTAEEYAELIQEEIKFCDTCQPYDGGEVVWILGDRVWIGDLFCEYEVPEELWDEVASLLSCPNCGREDLGSGEDVGVASQWEIERDNFVDKARKDYGKQIIELRRHLESYVSLGLAGKLGQEIMDDIQRIAENNSLNCTKVSGFYYKARTVTGSKVFTIADTGAAPQGLSEEGRFNHAGQSVLYIASIEYGAALEVIDDMEQPALLWMQKYSLDDVAPLLDLAVDWNEISTAHSPLLVALSNTGVLTEQVEDKKSKWKPQYFLTRFVADCARQAGMKGIVYNSARSWSKNIALFEPNTCPMVPDGEPYTYKYIPPDKGPGIHVTLLHGLDEFEFEDS